MVVKDKTYLISCGVFLIQYLQEADKISTFVGLAYKRDRLAGKQVNGCKQRQRAQPYIFVYDTLELPKKSVRIPHFQKGKFPIKSGTY